MTTTMTYTSAGLTTAALAIIVGHQGGTDGRCLVCGTATPCARRGAAVRIASRLRYFFPIPSVPDALAFGADGTDPTAVDELPARWGELT